MKRTFQRILSGLFLSLATAVGAVDSPNAQERELANLIVNAPQQRRPQMIYHPALNFIARMRAMDLATRRYFAHTDPDGYGPNYAIYLTGWGFPNNNWITPKDRNSVESLTAATLTPREAFDTLMASSQHQLHLMGGNNVYAAETYYGVGYVNVPGSPYQHYYVFLSAPPPRSGLQISEPYLEWLYSRYTTAQIAATSDNSDVDGDGIPQIMEFALALDPQVRNVMPVPQRRFNPDRYEWILPVRADLGSVRAVVSFSADLATWTTGPVSRSGDLFTAPFQGDRGFIRFEASR